jgi:predicted outer membrane protein
MTVARTLALAAAALAAAFWSGASSPAQEPQPTRGAQRPGEQSQDQTRRQTDPTRTRDQDRQRPGAGQQDPNQPGEARTREQGAQRQGAQQQLETTLAAKLALCNYEEVVLGQLASERAQNPEVKQFAQQMVQDHRQALTKLRQFRPSIQWQEFQQISDQSAQGRAATGQEDPAVARRGAEPGRTDRPTADRDDARRDLTAGREGQPRDAAGPGEGEVGRGQEGGAQAGPHRFILQISRETCKHKLEHTKRLLSQKQGAEFDKAYINQQIVAHVGALAELQAVEDQGSQQFQSFVKQTIPHVEQHLQKAQQIAQQLEGQGAAQPGAFPPGVQPGARQPGAQPGARQPGAISPELNQALSRERARELATPTSRSVRSAQMHERVAMAQRRRQGAAV